MRLLFFDPNPLDYVVETPRGRPLGGSQSGLCYLAEALAKRGHQVVLVNRTTTPGVSRGVHCLNIDQMPIPQYGQFDAIVLMNWASESIARQLRAGMASHAPLVLWTQHNNDQAAMQELTGAADAAVIWRSVAVVAGFALAALALGAATLRRRTP